jgi:hypothetical protein
MNNGTIDASTMNRIQSCWSLVCRQVYLKMFWSMALVLPFNGRATAGAAARDPDRPAPPGGERTDSP